MKKLSRVDLFWIALLGAVVILLVAFSFMGIISGRELIADTPSLVTTQHIREKEYTTEGHTIDDPLVVVDPYNASPLSAIVLFETENLVKPKVHIAGKDDKTSIDFTFKIGSQHVLPIYGLYPDADNEVTISFDDTVQTIHIHTQPLPETLAKATVKVADRDNLDSDWYFFTPSSVGYTAAYDINGDVRWYLSNYALWDITRLQNGHILVSTERLMNTPYYMTGLYEIDLLGKIHAEYSIPGGYHHDYFEMENGNLLIASDNFDDGNDTVEDYVVEMERLTGNIVKKFNLKDILPTENTGNENWSGDDWFHNNSVWYDKDTNSILLSGRHADAVIAINYDNGELRWILGDPTGWPEKYQHYFFKPIGDVEWQWSQHAAMVTPEGYVFVFDNGNNKSKVSANYVPAPNSYSRGVMYKIDTYNMTVEQVWEYGKARGSGFYSPYISDVDYINPGHYIIHSGGISTKDGVAQNQPAGIVHADTLISDTVEILNDKVIFEMTLPTNTYRVEKMPAYTSESGRGLEFGLTPRIGNLGKTEVAETRYGLLVGEDAKKILYDHQVKIDKQEDRIVFTGTFKRGSNVRLVLKQSLEQKYYKMRITDKIHAALCVAVFSEDENEGEDDLTVTRYINGEGLNGKYDLYLEVYDKLYDLKSQIRF